MWHCRKALGARKATDVETAASSAPSSSQPSQDDLEAQMLPVSAAAEAQRTSSGPSCLPDQPVLAGMHQVVLCFQALGGRSSLNQAHSDPSHGHGLSQIPVCIGIHGHGCDPCLQRTAEPLSQSGCYGIACHHPLHPWRTLISQTLQSFHDGSSDIVGFAVSVGFPCFLLSCCTLLLPPSYTHFSRFLQRLHDMEGRAMGAGLPNCSK